jgi:ATP adenylyltransferase/5',5'''-P-1,P-4-tetraphosphate phosphorylase II
MDKITKKPEVEFKEFVADVCANHCGKDYCQDCYIQILQEAMRIIKRSRVAKGK